MILAMRPELVDMQEVPENDEGQALKRLQALKEVGVRTGIWWYADYPTHYAGHAVAAQAEVGDRLFDRMAQYVARAVRVIKADTETERLLKEFYAASQEPSVPQRPTGN
jgi:creatinine amidohydrolase